MPSWDYAIPDLILLPESVLDEEDFFKLVVCPQNGSNSHYQTHWHDQRMQSLQ